MINGVERIVEYKRLFLGTITIRYDGSIEHSITPLGGKEVQHKAAVLCSSADPLWYLMNKESTKYFGTSSKLYISSDVKVPRDIYRKAGFTLKRDPDSADITIIPYLEKRLTRYVYDVAFFEPTCSYLYLYTVERHGNDTPELSKEQKKAIFDHFADTSVECYSDDIVQHYASLIPKCQEYYDLIEQKYARCYAFENSVKLTDAPAKFTVENLLLWEKVDSNDLLRKTILNSNWQDYPVTLCAFLLTQNKRINVTGDIAFKNIMRQIRYDNSFDLVELLKGTHVEPQDWNLLQDWVMAKAGIKEDKAFISVSDWQNLKALKQLLPKKIAVKAMHINEPMLTDNLLEIIGRDE